VKTRVIKQSERRNGTTADNKASDCFKCAMRNDSLEIEPGALESKTPLPASRQLAKDNKPAFGEVTEKMRLVP
jgi:hypothetical protein